MTATPAECNACGGALRPRLGSVVDTHTRQAFSILACERCGLGHTSPVPEDLGPYYGRAYHGGRHGVTAAYCAWRRVRMVQRARAASAPRTLLDIGCGDGTFLLAARRRGWEVGGIEKYPEIARRAGLEVQERVEDVQGPFGCVTLWHSLEHVPDPRATLSRVRELMAPEGSLVIAVPDWGGWQAGVFDESWIHLDVPRHLFHFSGRSLGALLERCGFTVARTWHQELEYDWMGWAWSGLNALGPTWSNAFFSALTFKRSEASLAVTAGSVALGGAMLGLSLPAVAAGTLAGRGGTLVVAARPRH